MTQEQLCRFDVNPLWSQKHFQSSQRFLYIYIYKRAQLHLCRERCDVIPISVVQFTPEAIRSKTRVNQSQQLVSEQASLNVALFGVFLPQSMFGLVSSCCWTQKQREATQWCYLLAVTAELSFQGWHVTEAACSSVCSRKSDCCFFSFELDAPSYRRKRNPQKRRWGGDRSGTGWLVKRLIRPPVTSPGEAGVWCLMSVSPFDGPSIRSTWPSPISHVFVVPTAPLTVQRQILSISKRLTWDSTCSRLSFHNLFRLFSPGLVCGVTAAFTHTRAALVQIKQQNTLF